MKILSHFPHQSEVEKMSLSERRFARDIYMKLSPMLSGNMFFSPFTIMAALGMVYAGAEKETKKQMKSVMNISLDRFSLHTAFRDVFLEMKEANTNYELCTSNMVYIPENLSVQPNYTAVLSNTYQGHTRKRNFKDSEGLRKEVNETVMTETNSRILELIPEGVLDPDLRIILVNTIYFKGFWEKEFKSHTTEGIFWLSAEESIRVPMMHMSESFEVAHHEDLDATVLCMDYKGSRLRMLIALPVERDGLPKMEAKIAQMDFGDLERTTTTCKIAVSIPKFKMLETIQLTDLLVEMGMRDLFDERASDLSGITGDRHLFVSQVIHRSFMEISERGTEAAAAECTPSLCTSYVLLIKRPKPPNFVADHPFLFFIRDQLSGLILFIGRLTNPSV